MRAQFQLFALICAMCSFASSEIELQREKRQSNQVTAKNLMKVYEKIDSLNERLEKLEANLSTGNYALDDDKNKVNITQIMHTNEVLVKKMDKIEELLFQLIEIKEQKMNESKNEIVSEVTSRCTSMCEEKVISWKNETDHQFKEILEKLDFCIKDDRKALNVCDPNPCLHGGRCEVTATGSDFQCTHCPYPMSGKRCENLNCGANRCFKHKDTVYVAHATKAPFEEAKQKCMSEGMTLAMPKDKGSTEFLIEKLRPIYGYNVSKEHLYFFIGLKSNAKGQWQWIDGSALGDYTGDHTHFKTTTIQHCAVLYVPTGTAMWSYSTCEGANFYTLCEKSLIVK